MFRDEIEIESSRMPASRSTEIGSLWEDMDSAKREMEELQAEPWPLGGFGG